MEKVAYELSRHLSRITEVKLIKWSGSNRWLFLILPYLLIKAIWALATSNVHVIYLQDGLLAPVGFILKITKKPVVITIHGRDITYNNKLYQYLIPRFIKKLDKIICISAATKHQCINRGISEEMISVIPNGISDEFFIDGSKQQLKEELSNKLKIPLSNKKVMLSVGRLVERKGIHWFVKHVMPLLGKKKHNYVYLIAGDGNFFPWIKEAIRQNNLTNCVFMLGKVDDVTLRLLYNGCDIFIMPNITVNGDMEGFGLVALEAASCRLPVVAADLEGIKEAIKDGENGFLVKPSDAEGYIRKLKELLKNDTLRENFGAKAREFTLENYGWERMAERYVEEFTKLEW